MKLSEKEAAHFFELIFKIQCYILKNIDKKTKVNSIKKYTKLPFKKKVEVRDELWSNQKLIDEYAEINPDNLNEEEIEIIKRWRNPIKDRFLVERILKKYAIFISTDSKVYGVVGLFDEIDELIDRDQLPVYIETVLLPFKDKIIYDGIFMKYAISFGKGMRDMFKATYNKAKGNNQIITSL